ncbi:cytochrome [Mycobacterium sp. E802]|uniref:cytochrome P450 n=1 Tax=Mycobacterium sp. E802 TaxID=1834152 RepID=UPI0007FCE1AA|nr:cytochrome P450 [Mycobacterium sp. E802]OBG88660.1 cytochrome [Mycobacterium sp. E802]
MTTQHTAPGCPHQFRDFDHHSARFQQAPYAMLDRMRQACPLQWSDLYGGFWSLLDYQSVFDAARDDDAFSSFPSIGVPPAPALPIPPIESDPPRTAQFRNIALRHFSPGAAERLRPHARQMATEMVNAFIELGQCDIVAELTNPLPAKLILHMLGFDESRYLQWVTWVHTFVHNLASDDTAAAQAGMELMAEINLHMQQRRAAGAPGDDLFGSILTGQLNGEPIDDTQITMYTFMMMLGGMDTTSGLTGNSLICLLERPELRRQLLDDPALLIVATEEFLRHSTPTLGLGRGITRDMEFHGQPLKAGERALLMWASANRDPQVFENPDSVNFSRPNSRRHMAFGVGIHRCMGSHIARMMFQEMMSEILERLPDFELAGDIVRFDNAGSVYAARSLPVRFTPGPLKLTDSEVRV